MNENEVSYQIRGSIFKVYNQIGPGLFESVYENALAYELQLQGLKVVQQESIPFRYERIKFSAAFRADLIVEDKVIIELKSVELLHKVHHMQLLTYLKITGLKLGLLVNFNTSNISKSIYRKVNGL